MTPLRVLTLNVLNIADRWPERLPLLRDGFAAIGADIAAFQEVWLPIEQDRMICGEEHKLYDIRRAHAASPDLGNSLLVRRPFDAGLAPTGPADRLDLGHGRSALRLGLDVGGTRVRILVTHLHHVPADEEIRDAQVVRLLDWVDGSPPAEVTIVTGDFNAEPDEAAALRMTDAGYRSGYAEATGRHPSRTFPSGLQAPNREGYIGWPEGCIDYVWIKGDVRAMTASLGFVAPAPDDPTLYPSDHFGVAVDLVLR